MRTIKRLLTVGVLALGLLLAAPDLVSAAEAVDANEGAVLTFDVTTWGLLQSLVVPLVVGLVLKATASSRLKVLAQLVINAAGALIGSAVILDGVATFSKPTLTLWAITTVGTIATHYGVWKPIGVTGAEPTVPVLAPSKGLG